MKSRKVSIADYAGPIAFIGNSLLAPMSQTTDAGIDPEFWNDFPDFSDSRVTDALSRCVSYAQQAQRQRSKGGANPIQDASVEYTMLFIGPPKPAAPPWETAYMSQGNYVGFGEPTFQMRELLREAGLRIGDHHNQYEDHMGIELLLLSEYCASDSADLTQLARYIQDHPLSWIGALAAKVRNASPVGYFAALLLLAEAILDSLAAFVRSS